MPSSFRQRTRNLFTRRHPVEHVPPTFSNNVHDLARVGGVSELKLPQEYAPYEPIIPTRFAATAQYLVNVGQGSYRRTADDSDNLNAFVDGNGSPQRSQSRRPTYKKANIPGLFRIPGSKTTTERLRSYFERQMYDGGGTVEEGRKHSRETEYAVRLPLLPNQNVLPYQVHDVASCFKSFLGDLHGGILGSLEIFDGLRKVVMPQRARKSTESADLEWRCVGAEDDEPVNPRHIARVLNSIECEVSKNLIVAVFGVLAFFMVDLPPWEKNREVPKPTALDDLRDSCLPTAPTPDARMTAEALGRIFAPLMLSEDAVKEIRMDVSKPVERRVKERRRQSWSPLKNSASAPTKRLSSPGKFVVARIARGTSTRHKTNIHINIHPHPLRSSPYLPLHEAAHDSDFDVTTPPHSAPLPTTKNTQHALYTEAGSFVRPMDAFKKAHANCSAPNLTTLASNAKQKSISMAAKKEKESKSTALLHDQQARMLLIANVITVMLQNWKAVCREMRHAHSGDTGFDAMMSGGAGFADSAVNFERSPRV